MTHPTILLCCMYLLPQHMFIQLLPSTEKMDMLNRTVTMQWYEGYKYRHKNWWEGCINYATEISLVTMIYVPRYKKNSHLGIQQLMGGKDRHVQTVWRLHKPTLRSSRMLTQKHNRSKRSQCKGKGNVNAYAISMLYNCEFQPINVCMHEQIFMKLVTDITSLILISTTYFITLPSVCVSVIIIPSILDRHRLSKE
jgi:hypothetical protein